MAADPSVTVRMYKEGLGDCFLLTFHGGPKPVHMLIDCGVIVGTKDASAAMTNVVTDLKAATGGHLDVVVATHEHWDHISGFMQAKAVFDTIAIDQVWLAWTEEPGNTRAQELKDEFGLQLKAVRQAMTKWGPGLQPRLRAAVEEVLTFAGDSLAAGGPTTADALTYLKKTRHEATQRYLTPGQTPFAVPGVEGIRVFVLGPPSADEYVRRLLPRKHSEDAYEMRLTATRAFAAALPPAGGPAEDEEARRLAFPFDEYYMIPKDQALTRGDDDFFRRYYGPAPGASDPDLGWRRIDEDWLTVAGQLALDLDNKTNNTCLVLAFEIIATGEVLLFPGDAQIGNWESWKTVTFTVPDGSGHTRTVTSKDLLARTVFYKVGHHGSHNATHRAEGLELMTSPDLVCMIPVNHEMAKVKRWNMPFPPLLNRLTEKCRSRVIRQDDPAGAAAAAAAAVLPTSEAKRFKDAVNDQSLFVECRFPM